MRSTLLVATVALAACASSRSQIQSHPAVSAAPAPVAGVPHFIEDDYPAALAQAKSQNKPLFVEAWAPW